MTASATDSTLFTVLGASAAWPNGDQASSGFVLQRGEHHLLLECGHGVVAQLNRMGVMHVDDIIVTHAHPDHCYDLVPLRYDYEFGSRQGDLTRPRLHVTQETLRRLELQASAFTDDPAGWWQEGFEIHVLDANAAHQIGPYSVSLLEVEHFIPAWAVRIDGETGSVVFTSDFGQGSIDELAVFSRGADLLLCEAAIPTACPVDHPVRAGHVDPSQAAQLGAAAQVQRLLITHVPEIYDLELALSDALVAARGCEASFGIAVAQPGDQIELVI